MFFSNPWKPFTAFEAKGTPVRGDANVAATKWWNHPWLVLFGWTTVAVLRPETAPSEDWYIGYRDFTGKQHLRMTPIFASAVRMKIGREDCTFFAVTKDKKEIPLQCTSIQKKSVPSSAPIL